MGSSSVETVVGYKYFCSLLGVIGGPIDGMQGIRFADTQWYSTAESQLVQPTPDTYIRYQLELWYPSLYGEIEGGAAGLINLRFGEDTQNVISQYAQRLNEQNLPALSYPYQSLVHFENFYFGNAPQMKELTFLPKRTRGVQPNGEQQWLKDYAEIDYKEVPILAPADGTEVTVTMHQEFYVTDSLNGVRSGENTVYVDQNGGWYLRPTFGGGTSTGSGDDEPNSGFSTIKLKSSVSGLTRLTFEYSAYVDNGVGVTVTNSEDAVITEIFNDGLTVTYQWTGLIGMLDTTISLTINKGANGRKGLIVSNLIWYGAYEDTSHLNIYYGWDINPIHAIREVYVALLKRDASYVDDANFEACAERIFNEGLGISYNVENKDSDEFIKEILAHIKAGIRENRQTGKREIVLFRDDLVVSTLSFNASNMITGSFSSETINADRATNKLNVSCMNRFEMKKDFIPISDSASILNYGEIAENLDFPYFYERKNAEKVANWELKLLGTPQIKGEFKTSVVLARQLNQYDVITITNYDHNINNMKVRIDEIELGDGKNNSVLIKFTEIVPFSSLNYGTVNQTQTNANVVQMSLPVSQYRSFEVPYYIGVMQLGQLQLDAELEANPFLSFAGVIASRPQPNSTNAMLTKGVSSPEQVSYISYSPSAELVENIDRIQNTFEVKNVRNFSGAEANTLIFINNELMSFVSLEDDIMTVKRGVNDTVPHDHSIDSVLFISGTDKIGYSSTKYLQSETEELRIQTVTPSSVLSILQSPAVFYEFEARMIRPYPPANVTANGEYWINDNIITANAEIAWSNRNRIQQTSTTLLGFYEPSVTLEDGVTYHWQTLDDENNVIESGDNVSSGLPIPQSAFYPQAKFQLWSERDGFESYQKVELILVSGIGQLSNVFRSIYSKNEAINFTLSLTGELEIVSSSITSGSLPTGWMLSGDTLSGSATTDGTYTFTITVEDENANEIGKTFTVQIAGTCILNTQFDSVNDKISGTWSLGSGNSLVSDVTRKGGLKTLRFGDGINQATASSQFSNTIVYTIWNNDFTVTMWCKFDYGTASARPFYYGSSTSNANRQMLQLLPSNAQLLRQNAATSQTLQQNVTWSSIPKNEDWLHVAITRKSGILRVFLGGQLIATGSATIELAASNPLLLGVARAAGVQVYTEPLWIDDIKIYQGIALWDSDFDPMTEW